MGAADWLRAFARRGDPAPSASPRLALDAPELFDDPYPLYARLRRDAPVAALRGGGYLLTRHADIRRLLTDGDFGNRPSRFSTLHPRFRGDRVAADLAANILPFLDPPEHTASRRVLAAALRERLRDFDEEIDELAARFVDAAPDGSFDVISEVAAPYTRALMCRLIGLPEGDGPGLAALTDHFFRLFAPLTDAEVVEEVNRGLAAFRRLIRARRSAAPAGSLLALLGAGEGEGLTEAQIVDSAILVFADGVENVATGAASVLLVAHRFPEAGAALEAGGADAAAAVSEALRLDSPAQLIPRIARRPTELRGHPVGEGIPVFLALGAANRDPEAFDAPDDFRLARDRAAVLTFGAGRHYCLGAGLAEAQIRALTSRLRRGGHEVDPPPGGVRYRRRTGHRWPEALPLRRRTGPGHMSR